MPESRHHVYYRVVGPNHVRVVAIWRALLDLNQWPSDS